MASSNGKPIEAPTPLSRVRRDKCFLVRNISTFPQLALKKNTKTERHKDAKKAGVQLVLIAGLLGVFVPFCLCVFS
jgi:hypothetical protein